MAEELTNEICALNDKISKLEERRELSTTEKEERVAITNEIIAHSNEIAIIRKQIIQQGKLSFKTFLHACQLRDEFDHNIRPPICPKLCTPIASPYLMLFETPIPCLQVEQVLICLGSFPSY